MKLREPVALPQDVLGNLRKARNIQRWSLAFMIAGAFIIYLTVGQSQAMKAVFVEDLLSIIPPASYLIMDRIRWRDPNDRFPYGYGKAVSIAFLASAIALFALGIYIEVESLSTLIRREHPTIGLVSLFGHQVWLGWVMIPALVFTSAGEFSFGKLKTPYAGKLHDTALDSDARMNRADWMSGAFAIAGVIGIALGWWWADALAAALIGFEIVRDGRKNLAEVIRDLMDEVPEPVGEHDRRDWARKLRERVARLEWVRDADVRLRQEGNLITGEVFVVPRVTEDLPRRHEELQKIARDLDWRLYDLALVPVERL